MIACKGVLKALEGPIAVLLLFEAPSLPMLTTPTVIAANSQDPNMDLGQAEVGLGRGKDEKRERRPCDLDPEGMCLMTSHLRASVISSGLKTSGPSRGFCRYPYCKR